jgi:molecular chaperone DnaK (HSP70)
MTREVALNALQKILGESNAKDQQILFGETYYNVQPVVTYPPSFDFSNSMAKSLLMDSIKSLAATNGTIQYISEPIAAIIAAKHFHLFPHNSNNDQPILVLDVGSDGLNISLVAAQQQKVLFHSFASDIGVDTLIRAIVDLCTRDFFTSYDAVDEIALQLLYNAAEAALSELSSSNTRNTRAQISIPYISMDFQTRKPLHLNMGVTPHLVEQEATRIILKTNSTNTASSTTKISDVLYYILMNFLEKANMTPYELSGVLLCGDGARSTIYQSSVKAALAAIAGDYFVSTKLIIPPNEAAEELVVIGSALAGRKMRGV